MSQSSQRKLKNSLKVAAEPTVPTPTKQPPPAFSDDTHTTLIEKVEGIINKLSKMEKNLKKRIHSVDNNVAEEVLKMAKDTMPVLKQHSRDINSLKLEMRKMKTELNAAKKLSLQKTEQQNLQAEFEKLKLELEEINISRLATDAILTGVPYASDENLKTIFHNLCRIIDYKPPQVARIFRAKPKNDSFIIIKFYSARQKRDVIRTFIEYRNANEKKLTLQDIGIDADGRIYLYESLTKQNHDLYRKAFALKLNRVISTVYTARGLVFIRIKKSEKPIRIDSLEKLQEITTQLCDEEDSEEGDIEDDIEDDPDDDSSED